MGKKVIEIKESDIEKLVNKTLAEINEEEKTKRSDLKPAIADVSNGEKMLVIVNRDGKVEAVGPKADYIKNMSKDKICSIVDVIIRDSFSIDESEKINELDTRDFSNIQVINFCNDRKNESKNFMGGLISESELESMVEKTIKEENSKPYDLYNPKFRSDFENELLTLLNKYLGISRTNDAGTSNDNRMFVHENLMNIINQNYPPSSLRKGGTDNEIYTNKPEKMKEFLNSIGVNGVTFKTVE